MAQSIVEGNKQVDHISIGQDYVVIEAGKQMYVWNLRGQQCEIQNKSINYIRKVNEAGNEGDLFHTDQLLTSEDVMNRKIGQLGSEALNAFKTIIPDEIDSKIK